MRRIPTGYQGAAFGMMDGIIAALGILTGLSAFGSKPVIFISILVAGIADAFANAAGMHVSEEIEKLHGRKEVWKSTLYALLATLAVFLLLALPILFFEFYLATLTSWSIAIALLILLAALLGKGTKERLRLIAEYVSGGIAISVLCLLLGSYAVTLLG